MCLSLLLLGSAAATAGNVPFWGAKASSPADTAPAALKPGEFVWSPGVAPEGPIVVVVSLVEQHASVYRNGVEVGFTTVSTGKPGHETPTGIFDDNDQPDDVTGSLSALHRSLTFARPAAARP